MFVFYSKSADKLPGRGANERVPEGSFDELRKCNDWRKKLSNFWMSEFEVDGVRWKSVEHYYQASKFKRGNIGLYEKIRDCESALEAKRLGGKRNKCDEDFFTSGRCNEEMFRAQYAKFTQNEELRNMLKSTGDVELYHYMRGGRLVRFDGLERIRKMC